MNKKVKRFLNKFFKGFMILVIIGVVINIAIIIGAYINHRTKLNNESGYLIDKPGQIVSVDGKNIYLYTSGPGEGAEYTIVFLHSTAMTDDAVTLQPLMAKLDDEYNVVYVDRCGNGYSDEADYDGTIESQLEITRSAVKASGMPEPYILVANKTAGLLETYWADKYPDEVAGMIGIGANYAEEFDGMTREVYCGFFNWLMLKGNGIGAHRFASDVYPKNYNAIYSDKQMNVRKALISKKYYTKDMYNEDYNMVDSAMKVKEAGFPKDIPVLEIFSNVLMEPYCTDDESVYKEYQEAVKEDPECDFVSIYNEDRKKYFSQYDNVSCVELSGPSELYSYDPDGVYDCIQEFVREKITNK